MSYEAGLLADASHNVRACFTCFLMIKKTCPFNGQHSMQHVRQGRAQVLEAIATLMLLHMSKEGAQFLY